MRKATERDKARMREYYQEKKAKLHGNMRLWRERKRAEYIVELGSKCAECDQDNPIVLDFDHIHDDAYRDKVKGRRSCIIRFFSKNGIDKARFQLLCKNCNWIKEYKRRKDALKEQSPA